MYQLSRSRVWPASMPAPGSAWSRRPALQLRISQEIAAVLKLSANTVAVHRANIMQTLSIHNTAELVVYAIRQGLVSIA